MRIILTRKWKEIFLWERFFGILLRSFASALYASDTAVPKRCISVIPQILAVRLADTKQADGGKAIQNLIVRRRKSPY